MANNNYSKALIEKIGALPPEKVEEVEDFVDFLRFRVQDSHLTHAVAKMSEDSFRAVWDNPEDAVYDQL